MSWVQTYTGRKFDLLAPTADMICLRDIAHALSQLCRFTGHTRRFYSVAEHAIWVSLHVPPDDALAGLMHDATETYLGDVSSPLKALLPDYKLMEQRLWNVIADKYGIARELPASVKEWDLRALVTERRDLLNPCAHRWDESLERILPAAGEIAHGSSPVGIETAFAHRAAHLLGIPLWEIE